MSPQLIKVLVILGIIAAIGVGGAKVGYEIRDSRAVKEAAKEAADRQAKIDELNEKFNSVSENYEKTIETLRNQKPRVITKVVEKEIENPDYMCRLPASGLQSHRTIIESLRSTRGTGKPTSEVPGPESDGGQGRTTDGRGILQVLE
jgi:hypothetical protein